MYVLILLLSLEFIWCVYNMLMIYVLFSIKCVCMLKISCVCMLKKDGKIIGLKLINLLIVKIMVKND